MKDLFPNLADVPTVDLTTAADGGARDVGSEDEQAGELGKPFTQAEDEEEWVGYVDWTALEAPTGATNQP